MLKNFWLNIKNFFSSKLFSSLVLILAILIFCLVIFKLGEIVGARKADFSCRWSDNYHRNFGGPSRNFLKMWGDRNFLEASGVTGRIIKINDENNFIVKAQDEVEKAIQITDKTLIKNQRETIKTTDLKVDDYVVIIGDPTAEGKIEAKLIRVLPMPAGFFPGKPMSFHFRFPGWGRK